MFAGDPALRWVSLDLQYRDMEEGGGCLFSLLRNLQSEVLQLALENVALVRLQQQQPYPAKHLEFAGAGEGMHTCARAYARGRLRIGSFHESSRRLSSSIA